jgi:hypothetical protein
MLVETKSTFVTYIYQVGYEKTRCDQMVTKTFMKRINATSDIEQLISEAKIILTIILNHSNDVNQVTLHLHQVHYIYQRINKLTNKDRTEEKE